MAGKIISLSPALTEIIYALGAQDALAANTRHCDYPPAAKGKNRIEPWEQPSVPLARKWGASAIFTDQIVPEKSIQECLAQGIEVFSIRPSTLEEVYSGIMQMGAALEKQEAAEQIVSTMRQGLAAIADAARTPGKKPRVYVEVAGKPPECAGLWVPKLVEIAGGASGLNSEGQPHRSVSRKEIFEYNPEVMVVAWRNSGGNIEMKVIDDRGWQGLSAMIGGRLVVLDDALLLRPTPRLVQGAARMAQVIAMAANPAPAGSEPDEGWVVSSDGASSGANGGMHEPRI
ncbi:MAG: ABC transporter substrate-binding protein [Candidatus Micrarchaeota archaeon]